MIENIEVIGFDADDTLWINEPYFTEAEEQFCALLSSFDTPGKIKSELLKNEIENLGHYGYGIKGFMLSMIETAMTVSDNQVGPETINSIIKLGKDMMANPVELLPGVAEVLAELGKQYRLIAATKGDLVDQERKLAKSDISHFFHHVEVLSDKKASNYKKLLDHLDIEPGNFLMIGNSLKSDVIPIVEIGANAIHVPFHTTWVMEQVEEHEHQHLKYYSVATIKDVLDLIP